MKMVFSPGSYEAPFHSVPPAMPGQKFGPAWFPGLIAGGLGICGVLLVTNGLRERSPWAEVPEWIRSSRARADISRGFR